MAQNYQFSAKDIAVSDVLLSVSEKYHFKVAFDAQKLSSVKVTKEVFGNTPEEFLTNLLENTGFKIYYKHERFLIVDDDSSELENANKYTIIGSVTDKETGEQMSYATVHLYNQNLNVSASANGTFTLKDITENPVHIGISYIGFLSVDTFLKVPPTIENFTFNLSKKVQTIDSVTVKAVKLDMVDFRNDVDFATTINPVKIMDLPVIAETDIFKTLQLLPGISYSANTSELSIRGGSSDQNLVLFDDQTLYNLSHYYGVVSAINPNVIKDIQVYKGGYDSRYGERVSGIVDITGKSGNQNKPTIYGDINLISGNITAELPIGKKITLLAAYRRSYSDIYSTSFSEEIFQNTPDRFKRDSVNLVTLTKPKFQFYDYNTKVTFKIKETESVSVGFFGSKDSYNNSYSGNAENLYVSTTDNNIWSNYGLSAQWMKQWNGTFFSNFHVGTSGYSNNYKNLTTINRAQDTSMNKYLPEQTNNFTTNGENTLTDISVSLRNTCLITNTNQLNFGFLVRQNHIKYHKDAGTLYVYDNTDQLAWIYSIYLQDRQTFFNKLTLKTGFRVNYYGENQRFYFEPRFSANYKFSDKFSLRFATGRYYQYISQVLSQQETGYTKSFWVLANDSIHSVVQSTHYIIGSAFELGNFLLDAEMYYKNFSGIQEYLFISPFRQHSNDFPNYFPKRKEKSQSLSNNPPQPKPYNPDKLQPSYFTTGEGKSYGAELFLRYKTGKYTSWVSYSISKNIHQYPLINNNEEIPAPTDQTHQLSWTNMVSIGKWNFGSIVLWSTGRPYFDYSQDSTNISSIRVYKRLPNYFRTDLSANYRFTVKNVHIKTGVSLINIFNTQNYFDVNTRKFDFENSSFGETVLTQSQALSLNFFIHFIL